MQKVNEDQFVKPHGERDNKFNEDRRKYYEDIGFEPVIKHFTAKGFRCITNEQAEYDAYLNTGTDKKHLPDILVIDQFDHIKYMIDVMTKSERNWGPGYPIYKHRTIDLLKRKEKYIPIAEKHKSLFLWATVRSDGNRFYLIDHVSLRKLNITPTSFGRPTDWSKEPELVYAVPRELQTLVVPQ